MRRKIFGFLLSSIFLVVFNIYFFLLKGFGQQPSAVWISYGSIHLAYFVKLITPALVRRGSRSTDYMLPLFEITTLYFFLALLIGVFFIVQSPDKATVPILVQLTLAAVFAGALLINLIANEHTADNIAQHEVDLKYVKESSSALNALLGHISDIKTRKKVEKAYDLIHSSPVKSANQVYSIEQEIISEIENLNMSVTKNDLETSQMISDKICLLADDRNRKLKLLNN